MMLEFRELSWQTLGGVRLRPTQGRPWLEQQCCSDQATTGRSQQLSGSGRLVCLWKKKELSPLWGWRSCKRGSQITTLRSPEYRAPVLPRRPLWVSSPLKGGSLTSSTLPLGYQLCPLKKPIWQVRRPWLHSAIPTWPVARALCLVFFS